MTTLFDTISRDDDGPALYAEPQFNYLNRSARSMATAIRQTLEAWFSHFPSDDQASLRKRFRSPIDVQHQAAFFELFLHELLLQLDYRVELHPTLSNQKKTRPDFLAESPAGHRFYLEAILATAESLKEAAARARINTVYDELNRLLDSPDFFVGMRLKGAPKTPPPAKKIAAFLKDRLDSIEPDEVAELVPSGGLDALPHWHYNHDGWAIDFFPIPKKPEARGRKGSRPVGLQFPEIQKDNSRIVIRDAIVKKAGRYGQLDLPYVVAVNALGFVDEIDVMEALFGKELFEITFRQAHPSEIVHTEMTRRPDGAWTSISGPRYTRVSGVLLAFRVSPWNLPQAVVRLCHNPWAQKPLTLELNRLTQAIPMNEEMTLAKGEEVRDILKLPPVWPKD